MTRPTSVSISRGRPFLWKPLYVRHGHCRILYWLAWDIEWELATSSDGALVKP